VYLLKRRFEDSLVEFEWASRLNPNFSLAQGIYGLTVESALISRIIKLKCALVSLAPVERVGGWRNGIIFVLIGFVTKHFAPARWEHFSHLSMRAAHALRTGGRRPISSAQHPEAPERLPRAAEPIERTCASRR